MSATAETRQLEMIKLNGRGAHVMMWLYFATLTVLAIWSLNEVRTAWPTLVAIALFAAVCVVLTLDPQEKVSLRTTLVAIAVWPIVAALVSWQLESGGGFSQWYLGAGTAALFYISLRGRPVWAWIGFVLLSAVIVVWGATTAVGAGTALLLAAKQFPILVVGTLFAIGLERTAASIQQLTAETSARAAIEAADVAATAERNNRLAELDAFATPLLILLVSGAELTEEDRREFAVAEAELRDGLRARSISVPPIIEAARQARRRGVDVVLLDDSDPAVVRPEDLELVITRISAALTDAQDGRLVARLLPPGREGVATLLVDG
ncbi:MAG TPA: hypothetical protein PLW15_09225, partial [Rhodoglobus sp.]|nr:hypothetical protein [Rhodoglobus sp.]